MGHSVTIGGDRLGSGKKMKEYLHNYRRSTHNLSEKFTSTLGVGMLVPFMCKLVTRDDKIEIDLNAGLRTIPTKGPLFGSFKLQLDVFQCPLRLYQALLHNNPMAIGLKANQVKFPKMRLKAEVNDDNKLNGIMAANNSLVKYLGISGIGTPKSTIENETEVYRNMFACGLLAYYDIFKNYYANKQEELALMLGSQKVKDAQNTLEDFDTVVNGNYEGRVSVDTETETNMQNFNVDYDGLAGWTVTSILMTFATDAANKEVLDQYEISIDYENNGTIKTYAGTFKKLKAENILLNYKLNNGTAEVVINGYQSAIAPTYRLYSWSLPIRQNLYTDEIKFYPFELTDIDRMRMEILSDHILGSTFQVDESTLVLYQNAIEQWQTPLGGLVVKTYQSDLFNNWIQTEWIDGENGIAAITAISTTEGSITIDAINFAEKIYNLLNRIAISGGTYYDYLDAAYTDSAKRFEETPIWIGGMSDEIVFEEIVQSAPTEDAPLGTLGGRGNLAGKQKGGKITVKVDEPALIIGLVSITPRIMYTQGNEFFNTEIESLADIHVPALDGIGFQNLVTERMHAATTVIADDEGTIEERAIVGKVPAWIEYMTSVDKAYGDFAATDGDGYMILNRDYHSVRGILQDATTYIDPAKYNYAFAYTKRDAQNFWVQIYSKITARRLMSARQIPTV